ncbi:hypothetical protein MLD38_011611 [Melastoma candidum]|uniref:Uncharacterized protein n=1 Tax=Melastoma candidum TaxID=119954 RepID=A0ACB9R458_9MYRT|nr:hypothetical protein MLD38_011611 [Melastoma candidum]
MDVKRAIKKTRWASFFCEDLAVREKFTEEGYGSVPRVSIICKEDKGIPAEYQRWMAANFGIEKVFEIDGADHSPMCSSPSELLNIFLDIAQSKM